MNDSKTFFYLILYLVLISLVMYGIDGSNVLLQDGAASNVDTGFLQQILDFLSFIGNLLTFNISGVPWFITVFLVHVPLTLLIYIVISLIANAL